MLPAVVMHLDREEDRLALALKVDVEAVATVLRDRDQRVRGRVRGQRREDRIGCVGGGSSAK